MKTFDLKDSEGKIFAFEVSNFLITRWMVYKIIRRICGVTIIRKPKMFSFLRGEEKFCEFKLEEVLFETCEPFGDSSRYWIGPQKGNWTPQIDKVRENFKKLKLWEIIFSK
jgi:hypothetical protein